MLGVAITLAVLLALALAAALFALNQRGKAQREERSATARALVRGAEGELGQRVDLALLLGLEAERTSSTPEGRSVVLSGLQRSGRVVQFLRGHEGPVSDVAFSRDGKLLASIGEQGGARLWDAGTRRPLGAPLGQSGDAVAFGPGTLLASGSSTDGTVQLWDARTRRARGDFDAGSTVTDLAFNPDGTLLAIGTDKGALVWDLAAQGPLGARFTGPTDLPATAVAFSADGRRLAAAFAEAARIWNVRTRAHVDVSSRSTIESLAFSPNGNTLAAARANDPPALWDLRRPSAPPRVLTSVGDALSIAYSPDGLRLAAGTAQGPVMLLDARSLRPLPVPLEGHTGPVRSVAFDPSGESLASASDDETVILWDAQSDPRAAVLAGAGPAAAAVDASLQTVVAARGAALQVWSGRRRQTIPGGGLLFDVDLSADAKKVATGGQQGTVLVADLPGKSGAARYVIRASRRRGAQRRRREARCGDPERPRRARSRTAAHKRSTGADHARPHVQPRRQDARRRTGGRDNRHVGHREQEARSGDRSWRRATKCEASASVPTASCSHLPVLSAPCGSGTSTSRAFPASRCRADDRLISVDFSPDGRLLAAGSDNGDVVLFDVASRQPLGVALGGHAGSVFSVAFADDGKRLASAGADGRVLLWDVQPWANEHALRARACERVGRNLTQSEWDQALPGKPVPPDLRPVARGLAQRNTHCLLCRIVAVRMMCGSTGWNTWPPLRTQ